MGATGCGCCQAYAWLFIPALSFYLQEIMALLSPFTFQHQRQAIDDDIQKAAYTKAEQNNGCIKQPWFCLEYGEYFQAG